MLGRGDVLQERQRGGKLEIDRFDCLTVTRDVTGVQGCTLWSAEDPAATFRWGSRSRGSGMDRTPCRTSSLLQHE